MDFKMDSYGFHTILKMGFHMTLNLGFNMILNVGITMTTNVGLNMTTTVGMYMTTNVGTMTPNVLPNFHMATSILLWCRKPSPRRWSPKLAWKLRWS